MFPFNYNSALHGEIQEEIVEENLIKDLYTPENEINNNCYFSVLGRSHQAIELAKDILMIYGDSVAANRLKEVDNFYQKPSSLD